MLEFELLRAFVAVAECRGFRRAAQRLNLTQSTISQQIKRLEQEAGRPLFRRTTRAVALTDGGEMLLGDARRLLQLEEATRSRLAAPRLSGLVRLGAVEEVAGGALPSALGRFARLHPEIRLDLQIGISAELIGLLDTGGVDVVLAKRPWGSARGRLAWREKLVWAVADGFDLAEEAPLPLALFREHSVSREAALEALRAGDRPWHIVYTSPNLTGVRAAALAGLGVAPLPSSALGPGLRILGAAEGLPTLPDLDFAIFEQRRPGPAAAALAAALATLGGNSP